MNSEPVRIRVEGMVPILNVKSVAATIQYYVNVLGFKVDWDSGEPLTYASVSLDGHAIMLCQGGQGHAGTWIWIGVEDVQSLFELFTSRGARVNQRLTNYPWAYEMRIRIPTGMCFDLDRSPDPISRSQPKTRHIETRVMPQFEFSDGIAPPGQEGRLRQ